MRLSEEATYRDMGHVVRDILCRCIGSNLCTTEFSTPTASKCFGRLYVLILLCNIFLEHKCFGRTLFDTSTDFH